MSFPDTVLTKSNTGKIELRALDSKGKYVICKYLDPVTLKLVNQKRKLTLLDDKGRAQEFFIILLRGQSRSLLIPAEKDEKNRKVWNEAAQREEELW